MGRAGSAGDQIGSAMIGARLARDVMRLAFLLERRYAPYAKWFGTAFRQLPVAPRLGPPLEAALTARTWQEREAGLTQAYSELAQRHHEEPSLPSVEWKIGSFFGRPFQVILGDFPAPLLAAIESDEMREVAKRRPIGSVDQFSDSTDLLEDVVRLRTLRSLFTA
jgi:hypothetical protein